jgi:hypothetical protein
MPAAFAPLRQPDERLASRLGFAQPCAPARFDIERKMRFQFRRKFLVIAPQPDKARQAHPHRSQFSHRFSTVLVSVCTCAISIHA